MSEVKRTRSEIKREAIIDAARHAFAEQGVQGTSMDRVAALAQVSKRTVYNHFPSKEALVMHLLRELWQQALTQSKIQYQGDEPLAPQLQALLEEELAMMSDPVNLDMMRVAFGHFLFHPEQMQAEMEKYGELETGLQRWLAAAVADGRLKSLEIPFAVEQLHGLIKGCGFWPQVLMSMPPLGESERQHLAAESAAMFLSHYRL
ncbi:TetR/AcrR family transcriptional regulator [Ferrimonas futtsuensis]|uniref:TetR/AcrR family transcriptional regulator n=1 Tax=Ferrimonas futtsuensis TaxID=364764 RepID=UPI00041DCFE5|nr:TetR/AcrR family transcriptional regulator [Ferrimonas futtsuensis]